MIKITSTLKLLLLYNKWLVSAHIKWYQSVFFNSGAVYHKMQYYLIFLNGDVLD